MLLLAHHGSLTEILTILFWPLIIKIEVFAIRVKENVVLDRHNPFCCVRGQLNQPRVKETNVLGRLQKLLSVKGNMRGRIPCLCVVLGITFLWCHVHKESALDKVSV